MVGDDVASLTLKKLTSKEVTFELNENGAKKSIKIGKDESLVNAHSELHDLTIEKISVKDKFVLLSNGVELKLNKSIKAVN